VAVASNAANVSLIALNLGLGRLLDTSQYGAVAALLGVNLVGTVPGLALQIVLARRTATAPADLDTRGALWTVLLVWSGAIALGVGLLAAALSPVLASVLHLGSVAPMLWLAASLVPFVLVSAVQGLLQGAERFAALSVSLGLVGLGKLAGGLGGVPWGVSGVLAGTAICAALAAVASLGLLAGDLRRPGRGASTEGMLPELRGATSGMLGLFALQNIDVVLARHLLSGHLSGVYAAGSLTAKGVFWLLHVVAVVVFPRLSDPDRRKALLRRAFWLVSGTALAATLAATVTGPTVLPFVFGADYRTLGVLAGVFALVGSLVALAELLLYANLAVRGHRIAWGLWVAMTAFVGLVYGLGHQTVAGIAWLDALCLGLLVGYGVLVERPGLARIPRPRRADAPET
jgi:O-antigen/teichoic acid export membrane protein